MVGYEILPFVLALFLYAASRGELHRFYDLGKGRFSGNWSLTNICVCAVAGIINTSFGAFAGHQGEYLLRFFGYDLEPLDFNHLLFAGLVGSALTQAVWHYFRIRSAGKVALPTDDLGADSGRAC